MQQCAHQKHQDDEPNMSTQNERETPQSADNLKISIKGIQNEEMVSLVKKFIGEDGYISTVKDDDETFNIYFGKAHDYRYVFSIDGKHRNYVRIALNFGGIMGLLSPVEIERLKEKITISNNKIRCVKGVLFKGEDLDDDGDISFSIRYEFFSIPQLTPSSLELQLSLGIRLLEAYRAGTIDSIQSLDDFDE